MKFNNDPVYGLSRECNSNIKLLNNRKYLKNF